MPNCSTLVIKKNYVNIKNLIPVKSEMIYYDMLPASEKMIFASNVIREHH